MTKKVYVYYVRIEGFIWEHGFVIARNPSQAKRFFANNLGADRGTIWAMNLGTIPFDQIVGSIPGEIDAKHLQIIGWKIVYLNGRQHLRRGDKTIRFDYLEYLAHPPQPMLKVIRCVQDVLSLSAHLTAKCVFRGQSNAAWVSESGISRLFTEGSSKRRQIKMERQLLADFKAKAEPWISPTPKDDWDWLAHAQHYGVPTRLLDWTYDPLVALFFASEPSTSHHDGSIFCLAMPENARNSCNCHPLEVRKLSVFVPDDPPLRMVAQRGLFTVEPPAFEPFDHVQQWTVWNVVFNRKKKIRHELAELGYTWDKLFPDIEGAVRYARDEFTSRLKK